MTPLLLAVGFIAGLLTIASPCVLPVLPAVLASGVTTGGMKRAVAIATGVSVFFGVSALFSVRLLQALGLPLDFRKWLAVAALGVLALGFMWPKLGEFMERPFARIGLKRSPDSSGSGFVLGASLGLLYLPCGGPILSAISAVGGSSQAGITGTAVALTIAYSLGIAVPMFALILLTSRLTSTTKWLRTNAVGVRRVGGLFMALSAVVIALGAATTLQTHIPSYTASIEDHLTSSGSISRDLHKIGDPNESQQATRIQTSIGKHLSASSPNEFSGGITVEPMADNSADHVPTVAASSLKNYGPAPNFADVAAWINTPGGSPLSISQLRGKVVLVDFWTYSCINCLRSLPHVEAWYSRYKADGFVVVGVHTPEFDFEHDIGNVKSAVQRLGVDYPVDVDNNYGTWSAWGNNSWPAEYLIDQKGDVRYGSIGEGDYGQTEAAIRALLAQNGQALPPPTDVPDATPTNVLSPESYLGYERLARYDGTPIDKDTEQNYTPSKSLAASHLTYGGRLTVQSQDIVAGAGGAEVDLQYVADDVYLVLSGNGTATVTVNGKATRKIDVSGVPALYTLVSGPKVTSGRLGVVLSPGLKAYDFTFG